MKNQPAPINLKKIFRDLPVITSLARANDKAIKKLEYRDLEISLQHFYDHDLEKITYLTKIYGKKPDQKSIRYFLLEISKIFGTEVKKDWYSGEEVTFIIWSSDYEHTPRSVYERMLPPQTFEDIISNYFLTIDEVMTLCKFLFESERSYKSTERLLPFDHLSDKIDIQVRYRIYNAAEGIYYAFLRSCK